MAFSPGAATILGIIQGLTEFLPVSSSGHLVIGQALLGIREPALTFDIWLHVATLTVVITYFRRDIVLVLRHVITAVRSAPRKGWRSQFISNSPAHLGLMIAAGTIPTGVIGLFGKDVIEQLFHSPVAVGIAMLVTAGLLLATALLPKLTDHRPLTLPIALLIGTVQGFAIIPGISRSGTTIATALILRLEREEAARFSFLLSIPAIIGALLLQFSRTDLHHLAASESLLGYGIGFVTAAASGWFALVLLIRLVKQGRLALFSPYLIIAGILAATVLST